MIRTPGSKSVLLLVTAQVGQPIEKTGKKAFFFGKKNQKLLFLGVGTLGSWVNQQIGGQFQTFFASFFQKRRPFCFACLLNHESRSRRDA